MFRVFKVYGGKFSPECQYAVPRDGESETPIDDNGKDVQLTDYDEIWKAIILLKYIKGGGAPA